jgi:hypothetical protein
MSGTIDRPVYNDYAGRNGTEDVVAPQKRKHKREHIDAKDKREPIDDQVYMWVWDENADNGEGGWTFRKASRNSPGWFLF